MKVRVVNRRLAGMREMRSCQDNIFNQISDVAAPLAVGGLIKAKQDAQILRPGIFTAGKSEQVFASSPKQLQGLSCIGSGATVITRAGAKPVDDVRLGDMVLTRDNGFQPILWLKRIEDETSSPMTVEIQPDAVDDGVPGGAFRVSGRQGILLSCPQILSQFGTAEILARAGDLLHLHGVHETEAMADGAVAIMTPRHELISVNGAWIDTFAPDSEALKQLSGQDKHDIKRLVPHLTDLPFERAYPLARIILRREFARQFSR